MNNNFSSQVFASFKNFFVHFVCLIFIFLSLQNYNFFFEIEVRPYFILIIVFFWAIYRPSLFHPIYIIAIGVLYDMVLNLYIGLHSFLFLAVFFIVQSQRLFIIGQNYFVVIFLFSLVLFSSLFFEWAVYSIFNFSLFPYMPLLINFIFTLMLFPIVNAVLVFLRKAYSPSFRVK